MVRNQLILFIMVITMTSCQGKVETRKMIYQPDTAMLEAAYEAYREPTIQYRRFKHADMEPLLLRHQGQGIFDVSQLGLSVLKKPIYQLKYGTGEKKVMLWSQMHGNEPTATMALLDIFNFLAGKGDGWDSVRHLLAEHTSLYFIPMLNPDGADVYTRRNAMDIDINRDARAGETVEGAMLIQAAEAVKPDYGFNLHDQHIYYNVPGTPTPVTIALLAPAYNYEREVNEVRKRAMQIAGGMNLLLQQYIPNAVAKYDDAHTPRGFGDNFQKWGASTVLIESGGYAGDPEKQYIRKLNFFIILNALIEIAQGSYTQYTQGDYEDLPFNDNKLSDLLLRNVGTLRGDVSYHVDLAIKRDEITVYTGFYVRSRIDDIGDLRESYGYVELDASGYEFMQGTIYPTVFNSVNQLTMATAMDLLRQGYFAIQVANLPDNRSHGLPLVVFNSRKPAFASPNLGREANFFLAKDGKPRYAVINGYLIDLTTDQAADLKNYVQ